MRTWTDRPFPPVTDLREVAARGAEISTGNGQSTVIYESAAHPGWLVKLYTPGCRREPDEVLDRLIALPETMTPRGRRLVDQSVSWPVTRIVDGSRTVGVALAKAPAEFYAPFRLLSEETERRPLEIDHLMPLRPGDYEQWGMEPPTWDERRRVARHLLLIADLFERCGVVYGDWSYSNAFWARGSGRIFVIDVDGCGFGTRAWVETHGWAMPGLRPDERLDVRADRYRVALAVVRCLTGVRGDPLRAYEALPGALHATEFGRELHTALTAEPDLLPVSGALLELLETHYDVAARRRIPPPPPPPPPEPLPEPRPEFAPEPDPEPEPESDTGADTDAGPRAPEIEYVPEPPADSEYWDLLRPEPAEDGSRERKEAVGFPDDTEQEYVPEPDDTPGPSLKERLSFYRRRARS